MIYLCAFIAILFTGSGRYAVDRIGSSSGRERPGTINPPVPMRRCWAGTPPDGVQRLMSLMRRGASGIGTSTR